MRDLKSTVAMKLKAALLLLIGLLSAALLVVETPAWRTVLLLVVCVWAFCRCYYFAFYVIERYVDPSYRFAGLGSALRHLLTHRGGSPHVPQQLQRHEEDHREEDRADELRAPADDQPGAQPRAQHLPGNHGPPGGEVH